MLFLLKYHRYAIIHLVWVFQKAGELDRFVRPAFFQQSFSLRTEAHPGTMEG